LRVPSGRLLALARRRFVRWRANGFSARLIRAKNFEDKMSVRKILEFPNAVLKTVAADVNEVDAALNSLAEDMVETMYKAPGLGLAAPQVGISKRLIVVDLSLGEKSNQSITIINPKIIQSEGEICLEEGCLSVPEYKEKVKRAALVVVRGIDMNGKDIEVEASDLLAVAFQHEIDHLNGVLFIDHLSRLKRNRYVSKRKKIIDAAGRGSGR